MDALVSGHLYMIGSNKWEIKHYVNDDDIIFSISKNEQLCLNLSYGYSMCKSIEYVEKIIIHFEQNINKTDKFYFPNFNIEIGHVDGHEVVNFCMSDRCGTYNPTCNICVTFDKKIIQIIREEIKVFYDEFRVYRDKLIITLKIIEDIKVLCTKIENRCKQECILSDDQLYKCKEELEKIIRDIP